MDPRRIGLAAHSHAGQDAHVPAREVGYQCHLRRNVVHRVHVNVPPTTPPARRVQYVAVLSLSSSPVYVLPAGSNSSKFGSGAYPPQVIAQHRRLVRRHRVPIEAAQRTMSKSKSRRYQAPDRASMWAALDPTPPSPTTRTDALVIRSMPSLAGDDDDE